MKNIIIHRCNTVNQLRSIPKKYGVEIDIRTYKDQLVLHHDPFVKDAETFQDWINHFEHESIILNVKEEGLEEKLIKIMKDYEINNYFFLDQSFPFLVKYANKGYKKSAVRFSEFESIDTVLSLSGKIEWVWIDYFSHFPLNSENSYLLHDKGFNICLVSPELQGFNPEVEIVKLQNFIKNNDISFDTVCTKYPLLWESFMRKE
jgi:hypothetical protein